MCNFKEWIDCGKDKLKITVEGWKERGITFAGERWQPYVARSEGYYFVTFGTSWICRFLVLFCLKADKKVGSQHLG